MTKTLNTLTITEAAQRLKAKECTVRELWDACHTAAKAKNPELNALLEIFDADEEALASAQKRIDEGGAPLLCGIPL
ncbi:MAG: Asp-tRNA(Asn)/Glu-tRNA(Gln) amidotransferase GatCAB subunit A, partial [Minisyncoccia bacterium]